MSDHTHREIPVLDDIISSPEKRDQLLSTEKENCDDITTPPLEPHIDKLTLDLDEYLKEPVLALNDTEVDSNLPDIFTLASASLSGSGIAGKNADDSRLEPAVYSTTDNSASEIPFHSPDNITIPAAEHSQHKGETDNSNSQTQKDEATLEAGYEPHTTEIPDANALNEHLLNERPLNERLYHYEPEPAEINQSTRLPKDENPEDDLLAQNRGNTLVDETPIQQEDISNPESNTKNGYEAKIEGTQTGNTLIDKEEPAPDSEGIGHVLENADLTESVDACSNEPQQDTPHESALIDYSLDVDPYSMDVTTDEPDTAEQDTATAPATDTTDDCPDSPPNLSVIDTPDLTLYQAEPMNTDELVDSVTEQVLQQIQPELELLLRSHIRQALNDVLGQQHATAAAED